MLHFYNKTHKVYYIKKLGDLFELTDGALSEYVDARLFDICWNNPCRYFQNADSLNIKGDNSLLMILGIGDRFSDNEFQDRFKECGYDKRQLKKLFKK